MSWPRRLATRLARRWRRLSLPTWWSPDYRLPITTLAARTGIEPRRADLAAWYLLEAGALDEADLREPPRVSWRDAIRVHDPAWLESLMRPEELARIFTVEAWDVPVDEVVHTARLAVGGTLEAARHVLSRGGPALNLLGGFHHAGRARGGGFCAMNDVAIAVAALRAGGFAGMVAVLDLDAHPPDGTVDCLRGDGRVWVGSLSAVDWGPLARPEDAVQVDETVLPPGCGDAEYLAALDGLLHRMPRSALVFVLAGGDVLDRDPLGELALSEAGAQDRDARVARLLGDTPAVWLPGGGYGPGSWRPLAGTGLVLATGRKRPVPEGADPLRGHFARVAGRLSREELEGEPWLTEADLAEAFGMPAPSGPRLLGFYTAQGVELALTRLGILQQVRRLGYDDFRVTIERVALGDRVRLHGRAAGREHLLMEEILARQAVRLPGTGEGNEETTPLLFVHWLTLRHPLASFAADRPRLPGQEVPGLGMAREAGELLRRVAERLGLVGVAVRPSWYHVAYTCRYEFRFVDPAVQGRFEALMRDLADLPLLGATRAVAEGRVRLDGRPYAWEAELMVAWVEPGRHMGEGWERERDAERERARFAVVAEADDAPVPPPEGRC